MSNASIYSDMQTLTGTEEGSHVWEYTVEIIADGEVIKATTVNRIDYNRDYGNVYGSVISCMISIGYATFSTKIYPNRDALKVKIRRRKRLTEGNSADFTGAEYQTFTALLASPTDLGTTNRTSVSDRPYERELVEQVDVVFQLSELAMFEARMCQVGGIYRNATSTDLLRVLMAPALDGSQSTDSLALVDYNGIRGVDVVEPTNSIIHDHIIIPPETSLVDLPEYLQHIKGVYSSGIGYFLQDGIWSIWPLRDHTQFSKRKRTLTVVMLPESDTPFLERSYKLNGDNVFIISTGKVKLKDDVQSAELNSGNGIRYMRASALIDKMSSVKDNKSTLHRDDTLKTLLFNERKDGLNKAPFISGIFTDNPYPAISSASKGHARELVVQWINADHKLLYPGMPVKVLYEKEGVVEELMGTLSGVIATIATATDGIIDNSFYINVTMRILVTN